MDSLWKIDALKAERVCIFSMSAVVHLLEFIDTGESADLDAAHGLINGPEVRAWIEENEIMMPLRRDGKKLNE